MNDLQIMDEMASRNLDIKASTNCCGIDCNKNHGTVKMMIDHSTAQEVMKGIATQQETHFLVLYVINKEQYMKIKQREAKTKNKQNG